MAAALAFLRARWPGICLLPLLTIAAARPLRAQPSAPARTALTFEAAMDLATSRNLNIAAVRRQRAIREAGVRIAGQIPNPDFSMEVTRDTPHEILSFNLPVEIGGQRGRRVDVAREELSLADLDVQSVLRAVRRELRQAFYSLLTADERVQIAQGVAEIVRNLRDAAQARFESGAAPRLDVLQADLGVTRTETDLELARSTRAIAQAGLNAVLNFPPQEQVSVAGNLSDHTGVPSYEQAVALASANNAELALLDREIAIEQRRLDLLRAERVPTPVFTVSGLFNAPPEFDSGLGGSIGLGIPLFTRNQGEIAQSISIAAQLTAKREAMRRAVDNDLFGRLATIESERRQVAAYQQRLVPTATDLEALAQESYKLGRTSLLAVLDVQRSLRDLRREALQAQMDLQLSLAELEEILGAPLP
jgi:outer membrane protein, heavy metal efflux system